MADGGYGELGEVLQGIGGAGKVEEALPWPGGLDGVDMGKIGAWHCTNSSGHWRAGGALKLNGEVWVGERRMVRLLVRSMEPGNDLNSRGDDVVDAWPLL